MRGLTTTTRRVAAVLAAPALALAVGLIAAPSANADTATFTASASCDYKPSIGNMAASVANQTCLEVRADIAYLNTNTGEDEWVRGYWETGISAVGSPSAYVANHQANEHLGVLGTVQTESEFF